MKKLFGLLYVLVVSVLLLADDDVHIVGGVTYHVLYEDETAVEADNPGHHTGFLNFATCENYLYRTFLPLPSSIVADGKAYVVKGINNSAFCGCSSIRSVVVPKTVEVIGYSAFSQCTCLQSVVLPNSIVSIGGGAFYECSSLKSVVIPVGVKNIEDQLFSYCSSIKSVGLGYNSSVRWHNGITKIGVLAFSDCASLVSVDLPDSVKLIDNLAFSNCTSLSYISIPNSVTFIGHGLFSGCTALKSVYLPSTLKAIREFMFEDCTSLRSMNSFLGVTVNIPTGVYSIGQSAFSRCSSIKSIKLPSTITHIGRSAFQDCKSLKYIVIPAKRAKIHSSAFDGCTSLEAIYVPEGSKGHYINNGLEDYEEYLVEF